MHYLKINILFILLLLTTLLSAQSIIGKWKTIDDDTGKAKSIVKIYLKNDKAYGKIIKLFRDHPEKPDPICDSCTDYRKDQKILGMIIITAMEKDDDEWNKGKILDPKTGKLYDCKLWIEDGKLKVRGYIAFFYRTQTWERVE